MPRIIITTGGTGGHIFPAIAVADALRASDPEIDILFIGSNYGPEKRLASQAGLPFKGLPSRGVLGRGLRAIPAACGLTMALIKALAEIRAYKPNVIAAFGGYACFPAALAAKLLKKPLLLHEQNAIAGACNQLIGKWADTICVSLPHTRGFNKDYIVTGNPVRHLERREPCVCGRRYIFADS